MFTLFTIPYFILFISIVMVPGEWLLSITLMGYLKIINIYK